MPAALRLVTVRPLNDASRIDEEVWQEAAKREVERERQKMLRAVVRESCGPSPYWPSKKAVVQGR